MHRAAQGLADRLDGGVQASQGARTLGGLPLREGNGWNARTLGQLEPDQQAAQNVVECSVLCTVYPTTKGHFYVPKCHESFVKMRKCIVSFAKYVIFSLKKKDATQPPTVVGKTEAQSEYVLRIAHTFFFFANLLPTCVLSRCLATKIFCIGAQSEVY